jgi:hypothetical protein
MAVLPLVGKHPVCCGQEGIAATSSRAAVDIFITSGVDDRDVEEDRALSSLQANIGFLGSRAQDQMGLRGGDFL